MKQFKVFYWRDKTGIHPAYPKLVEANSPEDAIIKADIDPDLIYGVLEVGVWELFCIKRRGIYAKDINTSNEKE